jgi:hypothetical protein
MRNKYGFIIVILVISLLLSGVALFLAKDSVATFFNEQADLASLSKPIKITPSKNTVDDSAIKSDIFKSLKNNVASFDFVAICKRPTVATPVVKTSVVKNLDGTEASSTPVVDISCRQGNNNPFLVKKK